VKNYLRKSLTLCITLIFVLVAITLLMFLVILNEVVMGRKCLLCTAGLLILLGVGQVALNITTIVSSDSLTDNFK